MTTILPSHDVECCNPDCTVHGITSAKGDLPEGWTFRRTLVDEENQVGILIFCPTCSRNNS